MKRAMIAALAAASVLTAPPLAAQAAPDVVEPTQGADPLANGEERFDSLFRSWSAIERAAPYVGQERDTAEPTSPAQPPATQEIELKLYKEHGGWAIFESSDDCSATAVLTNGNSIVITYNPRNDTAWVSVNVKEATSLQEGQEVILHIAFLEGSRRLNDRWGSALFTAGKNADGSSTLMNKFDGRDMLQDIAKSSGVVFALDAGYERTVAAYPLAGSAVAIESLRRCSFAVQGLNPNDPFLR